MNVYYSPAYAGSAYAFETTRKSRWVADSLDESPIPNIALCAPQALTLEQVCLAHDPAYVSAIQTGAPLELAQSQGFSWDPGLWPMVLASNGGAVAAALDALRSGLAGSLSSGLHHARRGAGLGYCTFNGLVIAAREALAAGARSVLILDLDAHCGGGSASMIGDEPRIWQLDVSVDDYDSYESSDQVRLHMVRSSDDYLGEIEKQLREVALRWPRFDLCLYNAGMDPFEGCADGALAGITREMLASREQIVFDWCRRLSLPVAFSLAGGYVGEKLDQQGLVDLHRLTLSTAAK
jgi:acetoin utilization deacetylase AcuC-like enzyme